MSGFLLDTNVISELLKPSAEPKVVNWLRTLDEGLLYVSVLTIGEIRKGIVLQQSARRRAEIEAWLEAEVRFRFAGRILPVSQAVAENWGRLTARGRLTGFPLPIIDGLMAATALCHDLTLTTRNTKHVLSTGVPILNPWES